MQNTFIY